MANDLIGYFTVPFSDPARSTILTWLFYRKKEERSFPLPYIQREISRHFCGDVTAQTRTFKGEWVSEVMGMNRARKSMNIVWFLHERVCLVSYRVRAYERVRLRCFWCWDFGHVAAVCRKRVHRCKRWGWKKSVGCLETRLCVFTLGKITKWVWNIVREGEWGGTDKSTE